MTKGRPAVLKMQCHIVATLLLASLAAAPQPNIILIRADDPGWGHGGWQNPKVRTPHLERLAKAGKPGATRDPRLRHC